MDARLYPREHGAYAELAFPLLSGLALGAPGLASWLFVTGAALLFLGNEPLAVLLGFRGKRLQAELAVAARRQLFVLGSAGACAGILALWLSAPQTRWLALVPVSLAACLVPVVIAKKLKTLPGEVVAAAAFAATHLPVAASGGVSGTMLWGPPVMWFLTTVVATLCVHAIKSRVTGATPWVVPAAMRMPWIALLMVIAIGFLFPGLRGLALATALPLAGVAWINGRALSPKKLKQVGWTVVLANSFALAIVRVFPLVFDNLLN